MSEETMTAPPAETTTAPAAAESPAGTTPAQSETTPAAPAEFTAPTRDPGEDEGAYLRRGLEAKTAWEAKQKPAEQKPAEAAKPDEVAKPEEKKDEAKPAEAEPEFDPEKEEVSLEGLAPLAPRALHEALTKNPEAKAALEKAGVDVGKLYEGQRLAAKAVAFTQEFPGGIEDAKFAKSQSEAFGQLDDLFTNISGGGAEAVDAFVGAMLDLDIQVDDNGQPLTENGQPVRNGNVEAFVRHLGDYTWEQRIGGLENQAKAALKANPDDDAANELLAAVEVFKRHVNGTAGQEDMTEAQKAEWQRINAEKESLHQQEVQRQTTEAGARETRIAESANTQIDGAIDGMLGRTDLPKEQWPLIKQEIRNLTEEKLAKDRQFLSQRDWIMRSKYSPAVEQRRVALLNRAAQAAIFQGGVMRDVLTKYGVKTMSKAAERQQKIAAQVESTQKEPRAAVVAGGPKPLSNAEIASKARQAIRERGGDPSDETEMMREMAKLRAASTR